MKYHSNLIKKYLRKTPLHLTAGMMTIFLSSCNPMGKEDLKLAFKDPNAFSKFNAEVSDISFVDNQLVIKGASLSQVKTAALVNEAGKENFTIESSSDNIIVANANKALSLAAGSFYNLVLSDANASAVFQVTIKLENGAITGEKISGVGANNGDYLKYNGSKWVPSSIANTQTFLGEWNASTKVPDLGTLSPTPMNGDYFVVSTAGTYLTVSYLPGDWIVYDGADWHKIAYSSSLVSSFQGRKGSVVLLPVDYVSLKNGSNKIPNSKLADFSDINVTGISDGQVLKWDLATATWLPSNLTGGAGGGITLSDLSATAPLSYSSSTGIISLPTAGVLALPLTGLATGSAVLPTDTILSAFGKLKAVPDDYISKTSGATMLTGTISLTGAAMMSIAATPALPNDVTNVTYVTNSISNAISANGVWNKGSSNSLNYTAGNVAIGSTTALSPLSVAGNAFISGVIYSTGLQNSTDNTNSQVNTKTTGTEIFRNIGDANPALLVRQAHASSTGDILSLRNSSSTVMTVNSGGNVGVGTTSPSYPLTVLGTNPSNITSTFFSPTTFAGGGIAVYRARGNEAAPATVQNYDVLGGLLLGGYDGTNYLNTAYILANNANNAGVGSGTIPTDLQFWTGSTTANVTSRMVVGYQGNVGIGLTSPTALLHVNKTAPTGTISSSGTTVTGSGTNFTTAFSVGDQLIAGGVSKNITAIASATSLTVSSSFTTNLASLTTYARVGAILNAGNVGIGTTTPLSTLQVAGAITSAASLVNASSTIDFSKGNQQYTVSNCGAYILNNLKDGGSYAFAIQGALSSSCSFNAFSDAGLTALVVHMPPNHGLTTSNTHTLYNFMVMGTHVYVSWVPGY